MPTNPEEYQENDDDFKQTGRIEAISDGVIAIVITLLAFEIGVPNPEALGDGGLWRALFLQWPTYFAFLLSFAIIGIMWSNHHSLFKVIKYSSPTFVLLNGLLLLTITLIPFATLLLAEYLQHPERDAAAFVYSSVIFSTAVAFWAMWRYARSYDGHLLDKKASRELVEGLRRQYKYGPLFYLITMMLAPLNVTVCLAFHVVLAVFFAVPGLTLRQ